MVRGLRSVEMHARVFSWAGLPDTSVSLCVHIHSPYAGQQERRHSGQCSLCVQWQALFEPAKRCRTAARQRTCSLAVACNASLRPPLLLGLWQLVTLGSAQPDPMVLSNGCVPGLCRLMGYQPVDAPPAQLLSQRIAVPGARGAMLQAAHRAGHSVQLPGRPAGQACSYRCRTHGS